MDNVNRNALLKELKFLTGLLEKHQTSEKEKVPVQQKCENALPQKPISHPVHPYKLLKNSTPSLAPFNKKYSFKKSNNIIPNQRIVINKNFKSKYELSKPQTSKYFSSAAKGDFKVVINENLSAPKRTVLCPENKYNKVSAALPTNSNENPSRSQLMEEVKSLTELLKKKNSENKHLNATAKNQCNVQNKPSVTTNSKYNFQKLINDNVSSSLSNRKLNKNYYGKLNSDKSAHSNNNVSSLKCLNHSKYSYKKADLGLLNVKLLSVPLNTGGNKPTKQFKKTLKVQPQKPQMKTLLGSHLRKVTYSDPKSVTESLCIPSNDSVLLSTLESPDKQNLTINLSMDNSTSPIKQSTPIFRVYPHSRTLCKASPIAAAAVKSSTSLKSKIPSTELHVVPKLKPAGTNYIRINKNLIVPNRSAQKSSFSIKKAKRKINTKYRVINKTVSPCSNKKTLNSLISSNSKKNSPMAIGESDSFYQKLNDSAIDKIEKNLLAISTALTSPLSNKTTVSNYKLFQHSQKKINRALHSKKMPLKRSKTRISKYKIVNSRIPQSFAVKKQNFVNLKTADKDANYSKLSLINKHLQPTYVLTPLKQNKPVLLKRLFKSKNTIINKNTSPISYSAKMIKSKYLTLNKRKFSSWQKQDLYAQVPPHHQRLKGYYLRAKLSSLPNKYKKTTALAYHPKGIGKFPSYSYLPLNRQFSKGTSGNKRKLKSGFVHSPIVFIHGMRYSLNSSGKTLKKLPAKGQTIIGSHRRVVISGKAPIKSPENLMKISATSSNVASRVLHRSINRIISASSKKSLTKVNTYCMFYNRFGRCNKGVKCTYIHDPSKIAVCTRFLRGTCKIDGCPFSHEIAPGKMALCSYFLVGACQKENCPYRHEKLLPNAELCKAFVQGYCPIGKECKKAHILICPKYIQGDCDKGKSCAYPHPPRKVKKNVPKEEECEEKKPDDVLLEKVSRYFLQTEDCLSDGSKSNNAANQVVPKQRRQLEEQPSFIPLFTSPLISNNS